MIENIKISIITVCFNSETTIERTIKSVVGQTYKNIEYIIVDGGSTDNTLEIIKAYAEKHEMIKWISEPDNGIYDAMNKGIRMSSGELIGIINSDDWYELDAAEIMAENYTKNTPIILYGMLRSFREGESVSVQLNRHENLAEEMIAHPTCFVSKSIYDDYGTYDTRFKYVADYEFMLRMKECPDVIFKPVERIIANFTLGGSCCSGKAWNELVKLRHEKGLMKNTEYWCNVLKSKAYDMYKGLHIR